MAIASANAAPRSIGTKSFPADSGFRPMDSIAFEQMRPIARAGAAPPTAIANAFAMSLTISASMFRGCVSVRPVRDCLIGLLDAITSECGNSDGNRSSRPIPKRADGPVSLRDDVPLRYHEAHQSKWKDRPVSTSKIRAPESLPRSVQAS